MHLGQLRRWGIAATGCDLSQGMLAAARVTDANLVNADVTRPPLAASAFDVVLARHMLYHVADRESAVSEMRRVVRPGGRCVVVTNGGEHMGSLRSLVEPAVRVATPGWEMRNPSTHAFSLETERNSFARPSTRSGVPERQRRSRSCSPTHRPAGRSSSGSTGQHIEASQHPRPRCSPRVGTAVPPSVITTRSTDGEMPTQPYTASPRETL